MAVLAAADVPGATDPLPPLLAQIPMTVRLQLLAERLARLRRQNPDVAITGEWDAPALWRMGAPGAAP
jgi:glucosamine--fructose-6-phosphate aminotransferase (isomerizing)